MQETRMSDELQIRQHHMGRLLLINVVITIIFPIFVTLYGSIWDYIITFFAAAILLTLFDWRYGLYLYRSAIFLLYLVKEIIVSNLALTRIIIQPKPKVDPGIIGVPLTVTTDLEITVLSLAIAATPGTLVVELSKNASGQRVLYVHNINVGDPDQFRAAIKNGFERMILQISRGTAP
jgi:multicomponent Na+:H+ antiporter subunit E